VNADTLLEAGLVHQGMEIKVLGTGGLKRKLTVEAHFFSVSAREAIEKAGGSVNVLGEPRKIGPRRTAAKLPKPLPTTAEAAPAATPKAEKAEKAARPEKPAKQQREQATPTANVEEATPPDGE
jgi:type IV secretory pathway VirB10-like protein